MLDNLRDQAASTPFPQDEDDLLLPEQPTETPGRRRAAFPLMNMLPQQRFILTAMLLVEVCLLGIVLLFITGKIVLPAM
ncbi:MAG: hypothetical protein FJZ96_05220 [Chloroflexi bacterium]|nr:hypothetical protein [Chloroflexota bacterium]